jgi:hypothetical protein
MAVFQKTKTKSSRARSRAENSGLPLHSHRIPMGGLLIGYECGAKNRLVRCKGFSRHILDNRKDDCLRYSTVPLSAPVFFAIFIANANHHPIGMRCPCKLGFLMPSIQALWPLRGSLRAFDSAPLNPWFRFAKYRINTYFFNLFNRKNISAFIVYFCKYLLILLGIIEIIVTRLRNKDF